MPVSATWVSPAAGGPLDLSVGSIISEGWMDSVASDLLVLGGITGLVHTGGMTITAGGLSVTAGNLGIGVAASTDRLLWANSTPSSAATTTYGIVSTGVAASTTTVSFDGVFSAASTTAAAYTLATLTDFHAVTPVKGAGSAITSAYGLLVDPINVGNVNNWGVYINAPSGGSGQNVSLAALGGMMLAGTAPTVGVNQIGLGYGFSASATGGGLSIPPTCFSWWIINIAGTQYKIAIFNS